MKLQLVKEYIESQVPTAFTVVARLKLKLDTHRVVRTVSQKNQFHGNYALVTTSDISYKEHRFCKIAIVINVPRNRRIPQPISDNNLIYKCAEFSVFGQDSIFSFIDSPVCDIMIKKQGNNAGRQYPSDRTKTSGYYYICGRRDVLELISNINFTNCVEKRGNLVSTLSKDKITNMIFFVKK